MQKPKNKEGLGPSEVALFKNTVSKTHFFAHVKKTPFSKKRCHFGFGQFPLKPLFLSFFGRLIFIHHQCWVVLPFCRFQRQRCIKILCPKDPDFYTPLALKMAKGQHLPALVVYKNQSPIFPGLHCFGPLKFFGQNR